MLIHVKKGREDVMNGIIEKDNSHYTMLCTYVAYTYAKKAELYVSHGIITMHIMKIDGEKWQINF